MRVRDRFHRSKRGAARGQMLVLFAITLTVFLGGALLGVDLAHIRSEVERTQHAADAAALAGVPFLPNFQAQAFYRAREEATKNGFTTNATQGISVTPSAVAGYSYRIHVTISQPVSLFFGHVFGLGSKRITVSATAEFLPPLQMGSPDYVLGFPRFPSYLTPARSPQNFMLIQNGAYTWKENGDPFDPFFESIKNNGFGPAVNDGQPNPCTGDTTRCPNVTAISPTVNQIADAGASFAGYKYVISLPSSGPYLVKLFDPFTSVNYNAMAHCWDIGKKGASSPIRAASGHCSNTARTDTPYAQIAPQDIKPTYAAALGGGCILGAQGSGCRNENIQSELPTEFHPTTTDYPLAENTLEFSLSGPAQSLLDPALHNSTLSTLGSASSDKCGGTAENCVIATHFDAGDEPTHCSTDYCDPSSVDYKFVNYAVLHGPAYFELTVKSQVNADGPYGGNGTYGEGSNSYGIAVCNAGSDTTYTNSGIRNPVGSQATNKYVTADPLNPNSTVTGGWNDAACPNPNPPTCPDPRLASPGQCVQIYGEGKLPLYNYLGAGSSLIPLGVIPADYAGHAIDVNLFDPGDVGPSGADPSTIFHCLTPAVSNTGTSYGQRINTMEVLTPAGDLSDPADPNCTGTSTSGNHIDGRNNTAGVNNLQPSSLKYSFYAKPDYGPSGYYATPGLSSPGAANPLDVGNGTGPYNGSWVYMQIGIPSTYDQMVNGNGPPNSGFGPYWKVLYRLGGDSTDVTVWTLSVEGSEVHLVNPS